MKTSLVRVLFGFGTGLALAVQPVGAAAVYTAAGSCQWAEDESFDTTFGGHILNNATSGIEHRVSCDMPTPGYTSTRTTDDIAVYYNDDNDGSGMEDAVICSVDTCNLANTDCNFEATRFSCATVGGCSSLGAAWEGEGYIFFSDIDRPSLYTTNVSCAVPNQDGASLSERSEIKRLWYLY